MTTFRTALNNLSNLSVTNVQNNYDVNVIPEMLTSPQLPALLVMPIDTQDDSLFKERGEGLQTIAFSDGAKTVNYTVTHLLIVAATNRGTGIRSHLDSLVSLIDSYMSAISENVTLSDALIEPAKISVEPGIFRVGTQEFYGCAFRHSWLMTI